MGKIYTKTISGRKYKYERVSTKRVGGKVRTVDKYLGAVRPYQGAIDNMTAKQTEKIKTMWMKGSSIDALMASITTYTQRTYARNTVMKWGRKKWGKRKRV